MPPSSNSITLLSPAELSFLHTSLTSTPPIRPDLRTPTQFRPLVAETGILPSTNGSARICFSDGTEAIVGIKAELEKTPQGPLSTRDVSSHNDGEDDEDMTNEVSRQTPGSTTTTTASSYIDLSITLPSHRSDDPLPTFLSSMLTETLLASPTLATKLTINARWHWRLGIDVLLLSPPLSYPLPLLSLTTHLALLDTALPRLKSEREDDPLFDDDWTASVPLYASSSTGTGTEGMGEEKPPITLLVMTAGANIIFDPSREELAVADAVLAVTIAATNTPEAPLRVLAIRTVDPPSRLTPPGVPDVSNPNTAIGGAAQAQKGGEKEKEKGKGAVEAVVTEAEKAKVWTPPRGGVRRDLVARIVKMVVERGGVGEEVLGGLAGVGT